MSEAKHTPGPWTATLRPSRMWHIRGERAVCFTGATTMPQTAAVSRANARLIAAAPDGLSANREALDFIQSYFGPVADDEPEGWSDDDARYVAEQLRAAISKAEGSPQ